MKMLVWRGSQRSVPRAEGLVQLRVQCMRRVRREVLRGRSVGESVGLDVHGVVLVGLHGHVGLGLKLRIM